MAETQLRTNLVNGQLTFHRDYTREALELYALAWKESEGDKIKFLAVRQCGTHQFGIVFAAEHTGDKVEYDKMIQAFTGRLRRHFKKGVNWDISSSITVID